MTGEQFAWADECTWTGNTNSDNWSEVGNWRNCGNPFPRFPRDGDSLRFPAGLGAQSSFNNLQNLQVVRIIVEGGAQDSWNITGNFAVTVTSDFVGSATRDLIFRVPIRTVFSPGAGAVPITNGGPAILHLGAIEMNVRDVTLNNTTTSIIVGGVISGSGNLRVAGINPNPPTRGSLLRLLGDNTYLGSTQIDGGTVEAFGRHPFGLSRGEVTLNDLVHLELHESVEIAGPINWGNKRDRVGRR